MMPYAIREQRPTPSTKGFHVTNPNNVAVNGLVVSMYPFAGGKCCLIMPNGKAAMSESNRPYVYGNRREAMEDAEVIAEGYYQ